MGPQTDKHLPPNLFTGQFLRKDDLKGFGVFIVIWSMSHMFRFTSFSPRPVENLEMTVEYMKETRRTKITVTSSLYEISTDQLGPPALTPFYKGSWEVIKDDVNSFAPPRIFASCLGRRK